MIARSRGSEVRGLTIQWYRSLTSPPCDILIRQAERNS